VDNVSPNALSKASRVLAHALRTISLIFEKASLPLCVSCRRIFWMTPAGPGMAREGLPLEMALEEWPLGPHGDPDR
jgi:hypothetical protein